jgi:hypothetical protein
VGVLIVWVRAPPARRRARRPRSQAAPASTAIHVGRPRLRSPRNAPTRGEGGVRGVLMHRCPSSPLPPSPTVSGDALGARASGAQAGETPALPGGASRARGRDAGAPRRCDDDRARGRDAGAPRQRPRRPTFISVARDCGRAAMTTTPLRCAVAPHPPCPLLPHGVERGDKRSTCQPFRGSGCRATISVRPWEIIVRARRRGCHARLRNEYRAP